MELSLSTRRDSLSGSHLEEVARAAGPEETQLVNGFTLGEPLANGHTEHKEAPTVNGLGLHCETSSFTDDPGAVAINIRDGGIKGASKQKSNTPPLGFDHSPPIQGLDRHTGKSGTNPGIQILEPPTPPMSTGSDPQPLSTGGIPWYLETFDPDGTTIQEERWTGRDLVRGMSEELSDMGDEELSGLVDIEATEIARGEVDDDATQPDAVEIAKAEARRKAAAKRRRWRGYR